MSGEVDWKTCKVVRHDGYQVSQISRVCVRHENIDDADSSPAAHAKPSIMQDSKFDVAGRLPLISPSDVDFGRNDDAVTALSKFRVSRCELLLRTHGAWASCLRKFVL